MNIKIVSGGVEYPNLEGVFRRRLPVAVSEAARSPGTPVHVGYKGKRFVITGEAS